MKKKKKTLPLLCCIIAFSMLYTGCGSQDKVSDTTTSDTQMDTPDSSQSETMPSEDEQSADSIVEESQETSAGGLIIPDYDYDEYIVADDGTPVLGYNIPIGWKKDPESTAKVAKFFKQIIVEENLSLAYSSAAYSWLSLINEGKDDFVSIEHPSVESPIGIFRIFTLNFVDAMDIQCAILSISEEEGVFVQFSYNENRPNFYQDSMELLLDDLFGEKKSPIEIPDNYEYYLQSSTGENILGVNLFDDVLYDSSLSNETYIDLYSHEHSINIFEYDAVAPLYIGSTNVLTSGYMEDIGEPTTIMYFTEKGSCNTVYGTAKLYDCKTEAYVSLDDDTIWTSYSEVALLRLNGTYIYISYSNIESDSTTNNIETILSKLF